MKQNFNLSLIKQLLNFIVQKNENFCSVIFRFNNDYYAFGKNLNRLNIQSLCKEYGKLSENWQRRTLYGDEYEVININFTTCQKNFVLILLENNDEKDLIDAYKIIIDIKENLSQTIKPDLWREKFLEECKSLSNRIFSNLVFDSYILNLLVRNPLYFLWVKGKDDLLHINSDLKKIIDPHTDGEWTISKMRNFFNIPTNHPDIFHKESVISQGIDKLKVGIDHIKFLEVSESGIKQEAVGYLFKPSHSILSTTLENYGLINQISLPMAIVDIFGRPKFTNKTWQEFFKNIEILSNIKPLIARVLERRINVSDESTILYDNRKFWIRWNLDCITRGGETYILVTAIDCTDQRLEEEENALMMEKLKRSNEDLMRFAHICSHDLKEPLRTISNFAQIIKIALKDHKNGDVKKSLDLIIKNTFYMKDLIENLLKYSEYECDTDNLIATNTNEIVNHVLDVLSSKIKEKRAMIKIESNFPSEVVCNKTQLIQVFQNIIDNAIKFNDKDFPIIEINYEEVPGYHRFSIKDNGLGIDNEYVDQIFVMFKRLHSKGNRSGSGIGLAMCKKIIENHKGKIWIKSVLNEYTIVYFDIPIVFEELKVRCAG